MALGERDGVDDVPVGTRVTPEPGQTGRAPQEQRGGHSAGCEKEQGAGASVHFGRLRVRLTATSRMNGTMALPTTSWE